MSLDIRVEADPASMRATVAWLRSAGTAVDGAANQSVSARTSSLDGWDGDASDTFRHTMGNLTPKIDALRDGFGGAANAIEGHANDIDTVKARMQQARDLAAAAGLEITDQVINDPGPAPPQPVPVPHNTAETPAEAGTRSMSELDWSDWVGKAKAYADASAVVTEGREIENDPQQLLLSYLQNVSEKWHINAADFTTGLAAGFISRQSAWKTTAAKFTGIADELAGLSKDVSRGAAQQADDVIASLITRAQAKVAADHANASRIGTWLDSLPDAARKILTLELGDFVPKNAPYLRSATAVIKKVPVVGTALTGGSILLDVSEGKDATTSIVSNTGGLVAGAWAGAAAGAAIGGPAGALVGFLVSTGTGWAIEEFMSPDAQKVLEEMKNPQVQDGLPWYLQNPLR
ncbi:hypothetical protein FPZ12_036960 [Amycolatopsis acidicola]|uniref:Uncharacterized protein n=1 Tax=Amycolatopsis acidicola TaxID=2596893 RepID=A0A5N0UNV9_9PSEU|nr:hypothetical protein [Amycolatopsis acidicola]KAA9152405.1 hypothetical protein FPZ12_036960 [Amycolatopsis acidicola]